MQKVMYVDESGAIGGAEEYLRILLKHFSKSYDITLVHRDSPQHREFYRDLNVDRIAMNPLDYERLPTLWCSYISIFKQKRLDLLHANLPSQNYCRTAIIAAKVCGVPGVVATSHLPNLTFSRSILGKLAGKSILDWFMWRLVFSIIDSSIVVSKASAEALTFNYPIKHDKVMCIYNGVDLSRFGAVTKVDVARVKEGLGLSKQDLVVTSVGRLHQQKGFAILLNAIKELAQDLPNVKLLVVGDGPLRGDLGKQVDDLLLNKKVIFAGERDDIAEILASSDIYVNSSLFEGLPFSILEAMAAGLPVIATAVDGNKELVSDKKSGILVPPEDATSLANALRALATDINHRKALGKVGQETISNRFSIDQMLYKTEQVYQEVAE